MTYCPDNQDGGATQVTPIFIHVPVHSRRSNGDVNDPANLHVIAVFFNFNLSKNLTANFKRFIKHMEALGVTLHIAELVRGNLPFEIIDPDNPHHIGFRTESEFFQKENLANLAAKNAIRRYPDLEYLALIDADVQFHSPTVITDTLKQLNRYDVVSMWSMACDLGPDGHPMVYPGPDKAQVSKSFGFCHVNGHELPHVTKKWGYEWHPGYAWAIRRQTWEMIEGWYDRSIIGSGDTHMSWAFLGKIGWGLVDNTPQAFREDVERWSRRAAAVVNGNLGYVDGLIHHFWHGRKVDRRYMDRWALVIDNNYDPNLDLWTDHEGLYHLTNRTPKFRFDLRAYMRARNDDANTLA